MQHVKNALQALALCAIFLLVQARYFNDANLVITYFQCYPDDNGICYEVNDGIDVAVYDSVDRYLGNYEMASVALPKAYFCTNQDEYCYLEKEQHEISKKFYGF